MIDWLETWDGTLVNAAHVVRAVPQDDTARKNKMLYDLYDARGKHLGGTLQPRSLIHTFAAVDSPTAFALTLPPDGAPADQDVIVRSARVVGWEIFWGEVRPILYPTFIGKKRTDWILIGQPNGTLQLDQSERVYGSLLLAIEHFRQMKGERPPAPERT